VGLKLLGVAAGVLIAGVLIGFYVVQYVHAGSGVFTPVAVRSGPVTNVNLTLQTVAAVGPQLSDRPNWVSYLVRNPAGTWQRRTVWKLPAHALVHVTIYNFDGASGLRNPFFARPQGVVGKVRYDGKPIGVIVPANASHTFAVPALGVVVPVAPVPDSAKNPCDFAPCSLAQSHRTITFTFRTGKPGHYRWQCFVPCAAGWINGFGGPMQTIGYMDGFLDVAA
jgi:hypothetical protein